MKHIKLCWALTLMSVLSCSSDNDPNPSPVTPTNNVTQQDVENAFQQIDLSEGIRDVDLTNTDNTSTRFRLKSPGNIKEKLPLVVALHWLDGADADSYQDFSTRLVYPGLGDLEAYVISPKGDRQLWSTDTNQKRFHDLITLAKKLWPVDTTKVLVLGYSSGGGGAWRYAETQPNFASAISMASAYHTSEKVETPLYVIHGDQDELFSVDDIQSAVTQSVDKGSDIELVVVPGLIHNPASVEQYIPYLQEAVNQITADW